MFAFEMTLEVALEFYRRKAALGAITEEQCFHILIGMAQEGLIAGVVETPESKDEYVKRVAKENKVLDLTEKNDEHKTKGEADGGQTSTHEN